MNWQRAVCGVAFIIATTSAWACSSDDENKPAKGTVTLGLHCSANDECVPSLSCNSGVCGCPPDNPECKDLATIEAGQQAVGPTKRKCVECHGDDMGGKVTPLPGIPDA